MRWIDLGYLLNYHGSGNVGYAIGALFSTLGAEDFLNATQLFQILQAVRFKTNANFRKNKCVFTDWEFR
jgi:hypothetical protein